MLYFIGRRNTTFSNTLAFILQRIQRSSTWRRIPAQRRTHRGRERQRWRWNITSSQAQPKVFCLVHFTLYFSKSSWFIIY